MSKLWGKIKSLGLSGSKPWRDHDASKTWSDGGGAEEIVSRMQAATARLKDDIDALVFAQVKEAVLEHARDGTWFMGASKGQLLVGVDLGNQEAPLLIKVGLIQLMNAVLEEAYKTIHTPDSQEVASAITAFQRDMARLNLNPRPPEGQMETIAPPQPNKPPSGKRQPVITRGMPPSHEEMALS